MNGKLAKALRRMARTMTDQVANTEQHGTQSIYPTNSRQRAYRNMKRSVHGGIINHPDMLAILSDAGRSDLVAMFSEDADKQ